MTPDRILQPLFLLSTSGGSARAVESKGKGLSKVEGARQVKGSKSRLDDWALTRKWIEYTSWTT